MINTIKKYLNLSYKNISIEMINYMIDDLLNGNGNNYTDNELITLIKAFCYRQIYNIAPEYEIIVLPSKELDKESKFKDTTGLTRKDKIYLNKELLLQIREKDVDILRTVFHETTHVQQRKMIYSNTINYKTFLLVMEQIIINETDREYTKDNYSYFYEEIDARLKAEEKLYDYLLVHNNHILENILDEITERILECEDDSLVLLRKIKNRKFDREELFDRIMLKHPEYREGFPLLGFYYNSDGTKLTLGELIKRSREDLSYYEEHKLLSKIKKLDRFIISNRRGSKKNLQRDLISLLNIDLINDDEIKLVSDLLHRIQNLIDGNEDADSLNELYNILMININRIKIKVESCKNIAYQYSYMFPIM